MLGWSASVVLLIASAEIWLWCWLLRRLLLVGWRSCTRHWGRHVPVTWSRRRWSIVTHGWWHCSNRRHLLHWWRTTPLVGVPLLGTRWWRWWCIPAILLRRRIWTPAVHLLRRWLLVVGRHSRRRWSPVVEVWWWSRHRRRWWLLLVGAHGLLWRHWWSKARCLHIAIRWLLSATLLLLLLIERRLDGVGQPTWLLFLLLVQVINGLLDVHVNVLNRMLLFN